MEVSQHLFPSLWCSDKQHNLELVAQDQMKGQQTTETWVKYSQDMALFSFPQIAKQPYLNSDQEHMTPPSLPKRTSYMAYIGCGCVGWSDQKPLVSMGLWFVLSQGFGSCDQFLVHSLKWGCKVQLMMFLCKDL